MNLPDIEFLTWQPYEEFCQETSPSQVQLMATAKKDKQNINKHHQNTFFSNIYR